jgi:hypothetical protein
MSRSTAPTHVRARRSHTAAVVISALTVIAIGLAAGGVWLFVREQVPRLCDEATQQLSDAATSLDTVTDDAQTLYDDTVHTSGTPTVTPATSVPTADYPVSDGGSTLVSDLRQALRSPEVVDLTVTCDSRGDAASIRGRADEVNERADSLRVVAQRLRDGRDAYRSSKALDAAQPQLDAAQQAIDDANSTADYAQSAQGATLLPDAQAKHDALQQLLAADPQATKADAMITAIDQAKTATDLLTADLSAWQKARSAEATAVTEMLKVQAALVPDGPDQQPGQTDALAGDADRAGTSASASPSASAPTSTSRTDGDIVLRGYCSGAGTYLVYRTSRGWTTTTANTDYLRRTC